MNMEFFHRVSTVSADENIIVTSYHLLARSLLCPTHLLGLGEVGGSEHQVPHAAVQAGQGLAGLLSGPY